MSCKLIGNYSVVLRFGDDDVSINPTTIEEFTIVQDMNKLLPVFRIRLKDAMGIFTHILPSDRTKSKVYIQVSYDNENDLAQKANTNEFNFCVYRRKPIYRFSTVTTYDIEGILDIDKLLVPNYTRARYDTIRDFLAEMVEDDFGISNYEIDASLSVKTKILQPNWTNAQMINWLKDNAKGLKDQVAFRAFIKCQRGKPVFVFKSLETLYASPIGYKFVVNDKPYQDYNEVFKYRIFDNYKTLGTFGSKRQQYSYFDYDESEWISDYYEIKDFYSLTDYFLVDGSDSTDSDSIQFLGTNNEFTNDFEGKVKANYFDRLAQLIYMWIDSKGLPNICPGDVVMVVFPQSTVGGMFTYQHSGYWLVEKVVHSIGNTFLTKLLLSRNGIDTQVKNSLVPATRKRQTVL